MSNLDRLKLLEQFATDEPKDPFNWYALALETQKKQPEKALEYFQKLLTEFPDYLPTYYPAAHFLASLDKLEEAKYTFEKGISLAKDQSELKTLRELQNAFQNFLFENDLDL
ncbi:tetratricopeptide repeat protein [Algoriphagus kandeliae]|uniref:Tetratricopeptide repeat protein n=1 Tax=Algoriphagus kandeliae TaxID=2562278 RepID=A0A4Y9QYM6_9BACT|nr:tetratricopeptide repeat protein [Algoriphagus kandeliae]TFV97614.1 tetratricopeptide repeat protein [Algoriphagus kandeliae]